MVKDFELSNLSSFVRRGGHLIISLRSGIKDEYDAMLPESIPGVFSDMTGVTVPDFDPLLLKETKISGVFGEGTADLWCDIITPVSAEVLGVYTSDYYAGEACLTVNDYGEGKVYYLGCDLDEKAMLNFTRYAGSRAGIPMGLYEIEGLERVECSDGRNCAQFLLNHNSYPVIVPLRTRYMEMISGKVIENSIKIEPYGVAILGLGEC